MGKFDLPKLQLCHHFANCSQKTISMTYNDTNWNAKWQIQKRTLVYSFIHGQGLKYTKYFKDHLGNLCQTFEGPRFGPLIFQVLRTLSIFKDLNKNRTLSISTNYDHISMQIMFRKRHDLFMFLAVQGCFKVIIHYDGDEALIPPWDCCRL